MNVTPIRPGVAAEAVFAAMETLEQRKVDRDALWDCMSDGEQRTYRNGVLDTIGDVLTISAEVLANEGDLDEMCTRLREHWAAVKADLTAKGAIT